MSGAATKVIAEESPGASSRGRGREAVPDNSSPRRPRSRSRLRKPKVAGSKLKGLVKSGWQSMKKLSSSKNSTASSDMASRTSTDNGSIALNSEIGGGTAAVGSSKIAAIKSILNSTAGAKAAAAAAMSESALELVVLVLDPISERFELLQLEFDSWKAKVSDLLTQIPLSVTEPALQELPYVGVLDHRGSLQEGGTRLVEAFGGSSSPSKKRWAAATANTKLVLVAKPKGLSTKETVRLAKPILTNTQVSKMLQASGFDISGWKSSKRSSSSRSPHSLTHIPANERVAVGGAVDGSKAASSGNALTILLLIAAASICLYSIHSVLTKPIGVGVVVPPGTMHSKCGVMGWVPTLAKDVAKTLVEPFQADIHTADNLWNCENEYMEITDRGEVKLTDDEGNLVAFLMGSACNPKSKGSCIRGVLLRDNKTIKIGNSGVRSGIAYYHGAKSAAAAANRKLSPWPFVVEPKVKMTPSKRT